MTTRTTTSGTPTSGTTTTGRRRRTQAERRAATRQALLAAAADSLVDAGFAGASVAVVAERAGVSTGALFHHFADKVELMGAVAEHISATLQDRFVAQLPASGDLVSKLHAAVDAVFDSYAHPWSRAAFELEMAARTDHDLAARLADLHDREGEQHANLLRAYLADGINIDAERLRPMIELVVFAVSGMALNQMNNETSAKPDRLRVTLRRAAEAAIEQSRQ